jgi:hypothetical protein
VVNPVLSVIANEYKNVDSKFLPSPLRAEPLSTHRTASVYRTLFYFAKLKPRLLFAVGACLRALQQTTVIQLVFDPSVGVGAGLNLVALATASRWPSALMLGWAVSKPYWRFLHAAPPEGAKLPIQLHVWQWWTEPGGTGSARRQRAEHYEHQFILMFIWKSSIVVCVMITSLVHLAQGHVLQVAWRSMTDHRPVGDLAVQLAQESMCGG